MIKIFKTSDIKNSGINDNIVKETNNKKKDIKKEETTTINNDIVDISGKSEIFSFAKKNIENIPDIRTDKVNALKDKIENGEYKIDEEQVADKIIKDHIIDELV